MAIVTQTEVSRWLETSKVTVPAVDVSPLAELIQHARAKVFSAMKAKYDTSVWVDEVATPALIRSLISMEAAGRLWLQKFQQAASEGDSYGRWLIQQVDSMLMALVDGTIELEEVSTSEQGTPIFYPTDASTRLYEEEGDVEGASRRAFTMGKTF